MHLVIENSHRHTVSKTQSPNVVSIALLVPVTMIISVYFTIVSAGHILVPSPPQCYSTPPILRICSSLKYFMLPVLPDGRHPT